MFPVYLVEISIVQGLSMLDSAQLRYMNITLSNTAWHSSVVKNCTPRVSWMPLTHAEGLTWNWICLAWSSNHSPQLPLVSRLPRH